MRGKGSFFDLRGVNVTLRGKFSFDIFDLVICVTILEYGVILLSILMILLMDLRCFIVILLLLL